MRIVKFLYCLIVLVLCFHCKRDQSPLQPEIKQTNIPFRMPQHDIFWPSLANSPWPMSTVNPQGIARSTCIGPNQGQLEWAMPVMDKTTQGGPAIGADGTIYIGVNSADFYAFNPDGTIKWHLQPNSNFIIYTGPVVASDSTIYVAGASGLHALNPKGETKWIFKPTTNTMGDYFAEIRPLLGKDGKIYAKAFNGVIYCISQKGEIIWENPLGQEHGISYMSISPDGSALYAPGKDKTLMAIHSATGAVHWTIKTGQDFYAGPTVDNQGNIYYPGAEGNDKFIYSITSTGVLRWKFKVENGWGIPYAGVNIDNDGHIIFSWRAREIIILTYDGQLHTKIPLNTDITDSPIICDVENNLYVFNVDNPTSVISCTPNGTLRFLLHVPSRNQLFPGAIGTNGRLYFGGNGTTFMSVM